MLVKIQPDATLCRYLFTTKSLYMFRVSQHPSSGVLKIVTVTSGTCHNTGTATSLRRGLIRPDQATLKVDIVTCTGGTRHTSPGLLKTVTATSGTGHNIGLQRGQIVPIWPRWREVAVPIL